MPSEKTGPSINRGGSKQTYETPASFTEAVESRYGKLYFDLAASVKNAKAKEFFTEADDSLAQDWSKIKGNLWLNPPFGNIAPWAKKCADESNHETRINLLIPASVGSNYFADYIFGKAQILFLSPRIVFVGETHGYPRDLMLCRYGVPVGIEIWRWK